MVVAHEVWVGVLGSRNAERRQVHHEPLLSSVDIFSFGGGAGRRTARLCVAPERKSEAIGPLDTLIAATALVCAATLVTRNVSEIGRVSG